MPFLVYDIAYPFFLIFVGYLSGSVILEYDVSNYENLFAHFFYIALLFGTFLDFRNTGIRNSWCTVYNPKTRNIKYTVWSNWLLKLFVLTSFSAFSYGLLRSVE